MSDARSTEPGASITRAQSWQPIGFTKAQAEKFIADAYAEMGPTCEEEWVTAVAEYLLRPFTAPSEVPREAHLK